MEITQVPAMSPPHDKSTPARIVIVKDVPNNTPHNINQLTIEDLKKILDQSTQQARLCENLVLVNVEEFHKVVVDMTRDKVNPQEPPSGIPLVTCAQPLMQTIDETSTKVDTQTTPKWIPKVQAG